VVCILNSCLTIKSQPELQDYLYFLWWGKSNSCNE